MGENHRKEKFGILSKLLSPYKQKLSSIKYKLISLTHNYKSLDFLP